VIEREKLKAPLYPLSAEQLSAFLPRHDWAMSQIFFGGVSLLERANAAK